MNSHLCTNQQTQDIILTNLECEFTPSKKVFQNIDLVIEKGSITAILGQSGVGKTTLLKCIAGLIKPSMGSVFHNDRVSLVYQDYEKTLFPWKSAKENILFAIKKTYPKEDIEEIAQDALKSVGLEKYETYLPKMLSGGMKQRLVLARALAFAPDILLLDEPFSSIDTKNSIELQHLLLDLWNDMHFTTILVTHNIEDALYLSDRVLVLQSSPARIVLDKTLPFRRPRNQISTKNSKTFLEYREMLYRLFHYELEKE
jgi:NitT/TauT family transport system ATP-binding protein